MKLILKLIGGLVLLAVLYLLAWPTPVTPVVWQPSPDPGLSEDFSPNTDLTGVEHLVSGIGEGPEDITLGKDGYFYTGLQDGRIMRFRDGGQPEEFVNTGGRPLGMQFDADGNLIVADAFRGLLLVTADGGINVLTDSVNGQKMLFPDDLDIAADGTIWFSDASTRFDQHHFVYDMIEASATGRLLSYSPLTAETRVEMDGLFFANGVALGPDDEYVLINETGNGRIHRLWLKGNRKGQRDLFFDGLPAFPDNLSFNGTDTFWVALPKLRMALIDGLADSPFLRKVLSRLPDSLLTGPESSYGFLIGLDLDGNVRYNIQDPAGGYGTITSVNQFGDSLYLGSIAMWSVGRLPVPAATPPDPLAAGWQGKPVCERLHEDSCQRVLRCTFAPGIGHERHFHKPHFGYAIAGGRMRITDGNGIREVDLSAGSSFASEGVNWHDVLNIGNSTVIYLIYELK